MSVSGENRERRGLLEAAFHVLDQGDGVQELALALGALLDPAFVPVLFTLLDTVDVVLEAGHDFGAVAVAGELALAAAAVDASIELGVVDDGQEDGVWHPLGLLGQHGTLVRGSAGVLVDAQALLVQELEAADLALFDLALGPVLGTVVDAVDVVRRGRDLLEPFRCVVAGKGFVASLAVDVEGKIFDHVRLEGNVGQTGNRFPLLSLLMRVIVTMVMIVMLVLLRGRVIEVRLGMMEVMGARESAHAGRCNSR